MAERDDDAAVRPAAGAARQRRPRLPDLHRQPRPRHDGAGAGPGRPARPRAGRRGPRGAGSPRCAAPIWRCCWCCWRGRGGVRRRGGRAARGRRRQVAAAPTARRALATARPGLADRAAVRRDHHAGDQGTGRTRRVLRQVPAAAAARRAGTAGRARQGHRRRLDLRPGDRGDAAADPGVRRAGRPAHQGPHAAAVAPAGARSAVTSWTWSKGCRR